MHILSHALSHIKFYDFVLQVEISRLAEYEGTCVHEINRTHTHEYYPGNYTQKVCMNAVQF